MSLTFISPINETSFLFTHAHVVFTCLMCGFECSYHLAEKKIPSVHGSAIGLKLEQFIFDAFAYSPSTALFEVHFLRVFCTTTTCSYFLPHFFPLGFSCLLK